MSHVHLQTTDLEATFRALKNRDPSHLSKSEVPRHKDYTPIPRQNYAPVSSAHTGSWGNGMAKFASVAGAGTIYGQPQFFSPVHTPINWQIPSKRLEQYQWSRFFYENEPKVASAIDFYSYFPMSDWEHECRDRKVKLYFDKFKKRLNIPKWCRLISHEVHLLGDCFPFAEISCEDCHGSGMIGDELCDHQGGTVKRMIILNPDYVDVHTAPLNPDPIIALRPDEELINMVQRKTPGYEMLSPEVIALVSSGQPIRLDNRNISHLMYGESGYGRYGIGMVRRLFPILSYKTKLMVAQWIVAERLIVPIKIVKVGSDERPAGPADIAAVQAQLAETANDPNLTIVTHHAFDFQWEGACHDEETEVLTKDGWKKYDEVEKEGVEQDMIASYDLSTNEINFVVPRDYHEFDYNGDLCHYESKHYDVMVTPNHKMLTSEREWSPTEGKYIHKEWDSIRADSVNENSRFKTNLGWTGYIPTESTEERFGLELDDYLEFAGFYVSEGGLVRKNDKTYGFHITQSLKSPCHDAIEESMHKFGKKVRTHVDDRYEVDCHQFIINNKKLAKKVENEFGNKSINKKLPNWVLGLPKREIKILMQALFDGDGNIVPSGKGNKYCYSTISVELADQVQELSLKLGYCPKINVEKRSGNQQDIFRVYWSDDVKEKGYVSVKGRNMSRKHYSGKVWCFTTSTGYFVTRRNGKVTVQGNSGKVLQISNEFEFINQEVLDGMMINNALLNGEGPTFSSASVGIEAMIQRLDTFRNYIAEWIYEFLYLPEAKRQGFIDTNPESGEEEYIVPKIKWDAMHLRDQQNYRTFMMQLYEKGLVSAQTVLESFDIDPDQEIERKRHDAVQQLALGQGVGQGQQGEMGDGFGGGGGGMDMGGGGMDMGGGGDMGAPPIGAGGDMGGPPAPTGGGGVLAKGESLTADVVDPSQFGGKVLKKRTRDKYTTEQTKIQNAKMKATEVSNSGGEKDASGQIRDEKGRIAFTKIERKLIDFFLQYQKDGLIQYRIVPQFKIMIGGYEHPVDFAFPDLRLIVEADGEIFHTAPKQMAKDKERDRALAQMGWTVLRFKDTEIEKQPQQVMSKIVKTIMEKEMAVKNIAQEEQQ